MTANTASKSSPTWYRKTIRRYKYWRWLIIIGASIFCLMWIGRFQIASHIYDFLDASRPPEHADVVVVLGGGSNGNRAKKAYELYEQGYAPNVIVSGSNSGLSNDLAYLKRKGIPSEVITINDRATSTWDEAQQVLSALREQEADSAIIVTDGFHTRRAQATYDKLQRDPPIELTFVSAVPTFPADHWWSSRQGRKKVATEYSKTVYYCLRYGVCP